MHYIKKYLPLSILFAGVLLFIGFSSFKSEPGTLTPTKKVTLVSVAPLKKQSVSAKLYGTGTVKAASDISVLSEVKGKVTYIAPKLYSGTYFSEGELLLKIDAEEYQLQLEVALANYEAQRVNLQKVQEQGKIARKQWEFYKTRHPNEEATPLTLREPQLKQAEAALKSALANVKTARLQLKRTEIRAPFNCYIKERMIDLEQYIQPSQQLLSLFSTDKARIHLQFKESERSLFVLNAPARISVENDGFVWNGRVKSVGTSLNKTTRMFQVIVEIDNPFKGTKPLLNGAFVQAEIEGKTLSESYLIPRDYIKENTFVYVENEGVLRKRDVQIVHFNKNDALITSGIEANDALITSSLLYAVDGLELNVESK